MFRPDPWQVPTQDGDQRPVSLNINVEMPPDADQTQQAALIQVAQEMVNQNGSGIQRWMNNNRQQLSLSGQQYMDRYQQMPGMDAKHGFNSGLERLHLNVRPVKPGGGPQIAVEPNLDGYILVVCMGYTQPPIGSSYTPIALTYDLQLNGTSLGSVTFQSDHSGAALIKFGGTALRCQSLVDKPNGPGDNPNSLVSKIIPPRPKTKTYPNVVGELAFTFGAGGITVPEQDDVFGYFLYEWNNDLNLQMGMPGGSEWARPEYQQTGITKLNIVKTIDGDPTLLNNAGVNKFRANLTSAFLAGSAATMVIESEFYDRFSWRPVTRSWTKLGPVIVNDRPMRWSTISTVPPAKTLPLDIDFTGKNNIQYTSDHPTPNGAFNGLPPAKNPANDGTPPYTAGYWRFGDGWSSYNGQPYDPWGLVVGPLEAFSSAMTAFNTFVTNQYIQTIQVQVSIFDPPYWEEVTLSQVFFDSGGPLCTSLNGDPLGDGPDSSVSDAGVPSSYEAVINAVTSGYGSAQSAYQSALNKALSTDVFLADQSTVAALQAMITAAGQVLQLILGNGVTAVNSSNDPPTPPSLSGIDSGSPATFNWGEVKASPFWIWQYLQAQSQLVQNGYAFDPPGLLPQQTAFSWNYTQLYVGEIASAYSLAQSNLSVLQTLLTNMTNYKLPEN